MAKIIMDSGKEYEIYDGEIDGILYETVTIGKTSFTDGTEVKKIRTGLIRLPKENVAISPVHISSIEYLED